MSFSGSSPGKMAGVFYTIDCCTLAADSGWNTVAQLATFLHGLTEPIKDQLAPLELPSDLDSLIAMAIHIDIWVVEGEKQGPFCHASSRPEGAVMLSASTLASPPRASSTETSVPPAIREEPMQVSRTKLTPEEPQRRLHKGRCI